MAECIEWRNVVGMPRLIGQLAESLIGGVGTRGRSGQPASSSCMGKHKMHQGQICIC